MLTIKNTEVHGLARAIKASGNPMTVGEINTISTSYEDRDWRRATTLGTHPVGSAHDHYLLGIKATFDILYPQYWTIEAERYHWFDILASQSKMHRIISASKSPEFDKMFNKYVDKMLILRIQTLAEEYTKATTDKEKYEAFMRVITNLPMGYEMWMTCELSYLQIKTIVLQRQNHKLKEDWGAFCEWAYSLPLFCELTGIQRLDK